MTETSQTSPPAPITAQITAQEILKADLPLAISALFCGLLGLVALLLPFNWFSDAPFGLWGWLDWAVVLVSVWLWAAGLLVSMQRAHWPLWALVYGLVLTGLAFFYARRFDGAGSDGHGALLIAGLMLAILPFAFLSSTLGTWSNAKVLAQSLATLTRQGVVVALGLAIFWILYFAIGGLLNLANVPLLIEGLTNNQSLGMTGFVGGACLAFAARARPLVVGFEALFWLARWLAPVMAVVLAVLALANLSEIATQIIGSGLEENSDVGLATTIALGLSLLPLIGASIEREAGGTWPLWLRISALALIATATILALLLLILSVLEYRAFGLSPLRLFAFGLRVCALIGLGVMVLAFVRGQAGLQRGLWSLTVALLAWCALYLSPLFQAEAWSAANLVERVKNGEPIELEAYDIRALGEIWGTAGTAALKALDDEGLVTSSGRLANLGQTTTQATLQSLQDKMTLYPQDGTAEAWFATNIAETSLSVQEWPSQIRIFADNCTLNCYGFLGNWIPDQPGQQLLVFQDHPNATQQIWYRSHQGLSTVWVNNLSRRASQIDLLIDALKAGTFDLLDPAAPLIETPAGILIVR